MLIQVTKNNQAVLIKADKRVSLERIVEVWGMCRDNGIETVHIVTN
jgi:biopolymer transport protein ExbD